MPIAAQFAARILAHAPSEVAGEAAMSAMQNALSHGMAGESPEMMAQAAKTAAGSSVEKSVAEMMENPGKFGCGALRVAIENTPMIGPAFRLGEAAVGMRLCEADRMTIAERQSLARGAAVDLVVPAASFVLSGIEAAVSPAARPMLEAMSPGITKSAAYKGVASALRADDPDRATQAAIAKAKESEAAQPSALAAAASSQPELAEPRVEGAQPAVGSEAKPGAPAQAGVDAGEPEAAPAFASANSISGKLAARRAAAQEAAPALAGVSRAPAVPSMSM